MKTLSPLSRVITVFIVLSILFSLPAWADKPLITASFTGVWDQPEQESQGIVLQIGEILGEDGVEHKKGVAYWFTYGPDLKTSWYLGVGDIVGNEIDMVLYTASDIGFMAENLEGDENVVPVGSLSMAFHNCNHGEVSYSFSNEDQLLEEGEFPIKRINSIYRQRCSGGINDDTPTDRKPMQMEVRLSPTDPRFGEGKAKLWERADRSDFKVEVEDMIDGVYTVSICDGHEDANIEVQLFEMQVIEGEGSLEFRSPEIDDKLHLNFDPRGCRIDVLDGDQIFLTSGDKVLEEKQPGKDDDDEGDDDEMEIEVEMTNTGVIAEAEGEAEFEIEDDGMEFSVKIKHAPEGLYALHINGIHHGDIEVSLIDGKLEGRVKLSDPQKEDTLELLIDPRGQLIEVRQNAAEGTPVILEVLFPEG